MSTAHGGGGNGGNSGGNASTVVGTARPVHFYRDFQKFMYTNNVVVAASGFSIGAITKEFITGVLEQIVLPLVGALGELPGMRRVRTKILDLKHRKALRGVLTALGNVLWLMFLWIATIVLTFVILEYFLNMTLLRVRTHMSKADERMFREAQGLVAHPKTGQNGQQQQQPPHASPDDGSQEFAFGGTAAAVDQHQSSSTSGGSGP